MFPYQSNDIIEDKPISDQPIFLKVLRPKLISTLNHQQEYHRKKKEKRQNRRKNANNKLAPISGQTLNTSFFDTMQGIKIKQIDSTLSTHQNSLYKEVFDGNDKISGYWVNGLLQGQAQIQYQNGDYFRGKFQKGFKTDGLMIFKDHGTYEGSFSNQQFHGKGVLRLKDKIISASWNNGIVEGHCVIEYKNGNTYYGPVKQFKKHGYGYLYFPNDTKFFGQFVQNQVKGYGQYYEKGVLTSKGLWNNGKLVQEKRLDEWSFNYEEEAIRWNKIEELFEKLNAINGGKSFFEQFLSNTKSIKQQDQKFKQMLNSLKKSKKKLGFMSQQFNTLQNDQIVEQDDKQPDKNDKQPYKKQKRVRFSQSLELKQSQ